MFSWKRKNNADDLMAAIKSINDALPVPQLPKSEEHYRIGYDIGRQMVTLTLLADNGNSMTLSMSDDEVDRMIRMIEAARNLPEEHDDQSAV